MPQVASPRIGSPGGKYLSDTLNWMKISGSYVAKGNETYLSLGNFRDWNQTNYIQNNHCMNCVGYYYIDDVSIIEINTKANAGRDTTINKGDSTFVGVNDIGDEYTWYANGQAFYTGSEAGLWVKPKITTTYICKQQVCSVISYDTCVVKVLPKVVGISPSPALPVGEGVRIYPNPVLSGELSVEC
jgi:hypothetical protein